jgi:Zn-dependent M16 (insulinase) family peptidase
MTSISEERNNVEIVAFHSGQNVWSIPIDNHEQIRSLQVFDINGKAIASTWESKNSKEIEILIQNHLTSGLTFLSITFESGKTLKKTVFFHD